LATSSVRLIQHASLRISVYAETLDAALPIVRDIERRFERSSFALDEGAVLDMRRERLEQRRSDDGVWTVALDYLAVTEHFPLAD
jgi:hypothetical protein